MERPKKYKEGYVNTVTVEILNTIEEHRQEQRQRRINSYADLTHAFSDKVWAKVENDIIRQSEAETEEYSNKRRLLG